MSSRNFPVDEKAGRKLFEEGDLKAWEDALQEYRMVMDQLKPSTKLKQLDRWFYDELKADSSFSREQLSMLMQWKLLRGKWRPLQNRIDAIPKDTVQRVFREAYDAYQTSHDAVQLLKDLSVSEMTGVGPATATAIATLIDPAIPFMSDAAMLSISVLGKKQYTIPHYKRFAAEMQRQARWLQDESKRQGGSVLWTSKEVEKALYSACFRSHVNSNKRPAPEKTSSVKKPATKRQKTK